jgi:hypothetical protein
MTSLSSRLLKQSASLAHTGLPLYLIDPIAPGEQRNNIDAPV